MGRRPYYIKHEGVTMKEKRVKERPKHRWYWLLVLLILGLGMVGCSGGSSSSDGGSPSGGDGSEIIPSPLLPPKGVTATPDGSSVVLTWETVDNATHYTVYWSTAANPDPATELNEVPNIKDTTWTHNDPERGTSLYYVVVAEDGTRSSEPSTLVSSTLVDGFKAVSGENGIEVSWDLIAEAKSYNIAWSDDPKFSTCTEVFNIESTSWTHKDLVYGKTYYYERGWIDGEDKPQYSYDKISATAIAGTLQFPKVFASAKGQSVKVSWNFVPGADTYDIYYSEGLDGGASFSPQLSGIENNSSTVEGLGKGTYYFSVVALNDDRESPASVPASAVILEKPIETQNITSCGVDFEFVELPAGKFQMGSPESEPGRDNLNPQEDLHEVYLSSGFYMMTKEVTQSQWEAVMGTNPSECQFKNNTKPGTDWFGDPVAGITYPEDTKQHPVENVYLVVREDEDAPGVKEFIDKLNEKSTIYKFRLPTEAEWEYVARAGTNTPYAVGNGHTLTHQDARFSDDDSWEYDGTVPVGTYPPNPWGIYDMHGNVTEWVVDAWRQSLGNDAVTDPSNVTYIVGEPELHCCRGGHYWLSQAYGRSACRNKSNRSARNGNTGFRLAADKRD